MRCHLLLAVGVSVCVVPAVALADAEVTLTPGTYTFAAFQTILDAAVAGGDTTGNGLIDIYLEDGVHVLNAADSNDPRIEIPGDDVHIFAAVGSDVSIASERDGPDMEVSNGVFYLDGDTGLLLENLSLSSRGDDGFVIVAMNGCSMALYGLTISTYGDWATGIFGYDDVTITSIRNTSIRTVGEEAGAIYLLEDVSVEEMNGVHIVRGHEATTDTFAIILDGDGLPEPNTSYFNTPYIRNVTICSEPGTGQKWEENFQCGVCGLLSTIHPYTAPLTHTPYPAGIDIASFPFESNIELGIQVGFQGGDVAAHNIWLGGDQWHTLSLAYANGNWGSVQLLPRPLDPNVTYPLGAMVELTATPIDGGSFTHWLVYDPNFPGDANHATTEPNDSVQVFMEADREVTGVFAEILWTEMTSGTTNRLRGVCGSGSDDVFAVGYAGTILHCDGPNFSAMASGTTTDLQGVWCSGPNDVYAVGNTGTLLHYDGSSWSAMASGTTEMLNAAWGTAPNDIFAVGSNGTILHDDRSTSPTVIESTFAGGLDGWQIVDMDPQWPNWPTVLATYAPTWHASGGADGGAYIDVFDPSMDRAFFDAPGKFLGDKAAYLGGSLEFDLRCDHDDWPYMNVLVLVGDGRVLAREFDLPVVDVWNHYAIELVHTDFKYDHMDGDPVSAEDFAGVLADLTAVRISAEYGNGLVETTGLDDVRLIPPPWESMSSGTTSALYDVWGSGPNDVFAVGHGGTILHYDGLAWSSMTSGTPYAIRGVWGSGANDVFAVDEGGTILRYAGSSWSDMGSGTTSALVGVWGSGPNEVFAVGDAGTILRYDGSAWSTMVSGTTEALDAVWCAGTNDALAVGTNGTILRYQPHTLTVTVNNVNYGSVAVEPNLPAYPYGMVVTLTGNPVEGKSFKFWRIYDPNHPGDANWAEDDANNPIALTMDSDWEVEARFKCGSSMGPLFPLMLGVMGLFVWVRRRA